MINKNLIIIVTIAILAFLMFNQVTKSKVEMYDKKETQIITYTPRDIDYPKREGDCPTTSTSTQGRPKTYRCYSNNHVYDPCFKVESGKIVCDFNPKVSGDEFELILATELPEENENYNENKRFDWAYELKDGTMCFLIQGTAGTLDNGEMYFYACDENKVVIGDIDSNNLLWSAQIGQLDQNSPSDDILPYRMDILNVWK